MTEDKFEKLVKQRKYTAAPVPSDNSALEKIKAFINDTTGTIELSLEEKKIFDRWKNIHHLRLDGHNNEQIITAIMRLHDVCERTVRRDFKCYTKIFRYDFEPDYEMYLVYLQVENLLKKARENGDLKTVDKMLDKKIRLIEFFKGDGSLPPADQFTLIQVNITAKPEDIGLQAVPFTTDELMKKFMTKKKQIELRNTEDVEIISDEPAE